MAKPNGTRGRIALPGVDLRDLFIPLWVPVGCSEWLLVAELRGCRQENDRRVKANRMFGGFESDKIDVFGADFT